MTRWYWNFSCLGIFIFSKCFNLFTLHDFFIFKRNFCNLMFSFVIFSFVIKSNINKQMKTKLLKNEEEILLYAWMLTLYKYFISVFMFLSDTVSDWNSFKLVKHLFLSVIVWWPTLISSPFKKYNKLLACYSYL